MSKFQPPMLNYEVFRAMTDKQIHKHSNKPEETFFLLSNVCILYFRLKSQSPIIRYRKCVEVYT